MKIDTVTVSIDYSDYLKKIISNKELLENWLIITHKDDRKTIKVCKDNNTCKFGRNFCIPEVYRWRVDATQN